MPSGFARSRVGHTGFMGTVVLGWDLDRGTRWVPSYEQAVTRVVLTGPVTVPWHLGDGPVPPPGARVHLMLQGRTRGLVGRGVVRGAGFRAGTAQRPGTLGTHVLIEWDQLRLIGERIPCEDLARRVPGVDWSGTYRDVLQIPDEIGDDLDQLWAPPRRPRDGVGTLVGQLRRALAAHR